ncbi:5-formyltetrahydrofolate cyclo-ligase, mitochondrial [Morella rubra]|uniref:5-formyltetrahydrofolate cyclo-ligase, mitochondrial n=1 Tax=Morella rubra TaxID=262757 RepID=A0A6A1VYS9_9ROSI|nr:5-formyltetrahydrofolate cyclo-ligase, mitochondrial [Morella rubra]
MAFFGAVMQANEPVDLFLLPGNREGTWVVVEVALSYSLQIMAEGVIAVTPNEVSLDALVSPAGVISISQAALERMKL